MSNQAQLAEEDAQKAYLVRTYGDQINRLNSLYTIKDKLGNRIPFRMNQVQLELYAEMEYRNLILKARQLGFTTFIQLYMLDVALFNSDVKCGIIAHNKDDAHAFYTDKIKFGYDQLPDLLRAAVPARTDRVGELALANGSSIRVSTSFRSGTLQILHVSEYGKISAKSPEKAREIKTGAIEAVTQGMMVFIESTAEGRDGEFYVISHKAMAMKDQGKKIGPLDYKFFFFAWWQNPEYRTSIDGCLFTEEHRRYFEDLEGRNIHLVPEQQAWWIKKFETLGEDMYREHPSYPEEAFRATIRGAYYGATMTKLRREGRICRVPHEPGFPVYTAFDLGLNDAMAIWFFQYIGRERRIIDYLENSGEQMSFYAIELAKKGYRYIEHRMPHDINVREILGGSKTRKAAAEKLGIRPIVTAPRPKNPDQFQDQINETRAFLASCVIDEAKCALGITRLEGYKKAWNDKTGSFMSYPEHGPASHGADALRTAAMCERDRTKINPTDMLPEVFHDS